MHYLILYGQGGLLVAKRNPYITTALCRPPEPAWHRKLRVRRQQARAPIYSSRLGFDIPQSDIEVAACRLCSHHGSAAPRAMGSKAKTYTAQSKKNGTLMRVGSANSGYARTDGIGGRTSKPPLRAPSTIPGLAWQACGVVRSYPSQSYC